MTIQATVYSCGAGFPKPGSYVRANGELYRVVSVGSHVSTDDSGRGRGNSVSAEVELADWDDCAEDEEFHALLGFAREDD